MAVQPPSMGCHSLHPPMRFSRHRFRGRVRRSLAAAVAATASALRSRTTRVQPSVERHTRHGNASAPSMREEAWKTSSWKRDSQEGDALVRQWAEEAERAILRCITPTAAAHHGQHTGAHRHHTTRCSDHTLIDDTGTEASCVCLWWRMRATKSAERKTVARFLSAVDKGLSFRLASAFLRCYFISIGRSRSERMTV